RALDNPERPVGAVVGGAKVSTKLNVLGNLARRVDVIIVGGGMANTFLHAQGVDVGNSLCERDMADAALEILETARDAGCRMLLPTDAIVAAAFEGGAATETVSVTAIPADMMMLDVGPATGDELEAAVRDLKTLVWNGPMGAFEVPPFDAATVRLARFAADRTSSGDLLTVAGGGDTVAALAHAGVAERFSYISTAGGAFLEWLEGRDLPGVAALKAAKVRS
ncbi:MAG: phosphoglycerate kinase, partial [Pseudomonadota bacterium]